MSSTSINVHIHDGDKFNFRQRALSSCHSVLMFVGQTEVTFFVCNQKQYDEMVDSLQSLVEELIPGRTPLVQEASLTQEEVVCVGDAQDLEEVVRLRDFAHMISQLNGVEGLSRVQLYHVIELANAALTPLTQEEATCVGDVQSRVPTIFEEDDCGP